MKGCYVPLFSSPRYLVVPVRPAHTPLPSRHVFRPRASRPSQRDLIGPPGSGQFGQQVYLLPTGNIVIHDPAYSTATAANVGAVYLYNHQTGAQISALVGSSPADAIGSQITVLSSGDFLISSPQWTNAALGVSNAGAITWCSGVTGCDGIVSASNSLIGTRPFDLFQTWITVLADGNAVIAAQDWDDPVADRSNVGAVIWCAGPADCTGPISSANALIGTSADDRVGVVTALPNGGYVINSRQWDDVDNGVTNAGASTWCAAAAGCRGVITRTNSLVGDKANDYVGWSTYILENGHYVVTHYDWLNPNSGPSAERGAVTWCSAEVGCQGVVSAANSLIGAGMGNTGIRALQNGSYVVGSSFWRNPVTSAANAGAVTWCDGNRGC